MSRKEKKPLFSKIKVIEDVQLQFNSIIRKDVVEIYDDIENFIRTNSYNLDEKSLDLVRKDILSNLVELRLNIETIIANFSRITGLVIELHGQEDYQRKNYFRKLQLIFLLNSEISMSYTKTLEYLESEIINKLEELREDLLSILDKIRSRQNIDRDIIQLKQEFFNMSSDLSIMIEKTNNNIEDIYGNIAKNKDRNINLGFLLISAFLSVILFFPEFNNMVNLKYAEVTYQEKIDQIMYEKAIDQLSISDLINIQDNTITPEMRQRINIPKTKEIIEKNMEEENQDLEREKDRINIFLIILSIILIPYILWIIFIAI